MPVSTVSTLLSSGVSVGIIAGVVSGLFYLVVAGCRWAGEVRHQSSDWLQRRFLASRRLDPSGHGSITQSEASQVRDFIERLVEALVAGGLDHINVNRLYSHPEYKPLDESDSPCTAHYELKQLVQRVVQEAMALPSLRTISESSGANATEKVKEIDLKTYEDILATAILNKVIQRFQQCGPGATGTDGNSNSEYQQTYITRMDHSSKCSSVDDYDAATTASLHDTSWSDTSQGEPSSLTLEEDDDAGSTRGAELDFYLSGLNFIKRHRVPFPELGMDLVDGEHCDEEPTDLMSPVDSWEENWLFQRRKLKTGGSLQPMPVPMLVPNPSEDFRALIGDQDAEDTSELSDGSDGIYEGLLDVAEATADRLLEEHVVEVAEARNLELTNDADSCSEIGQQDSEYTEDYATVTQLQINCLTDIYSHTDPPDNKPVPKPRMTAPVEAAAGVEPGGVSDDELASPPRPGTIAEREHRKWASAPPLPNNPYSPENIMKRLHKSSMLSLRPVGQEQAEEQPPADTNIARYGRDYYVNASKSSNGRNTSRRLEVAPPSAVETLRPEVSDLEEQMLHRDIYRASFRARDASSQFIVNPLYEPEQDDARTTRQEKPKTKMRLSPESGYGSSLESLSDPGALRLNVPEVPQMVERTLESLSSVKRSASLRSSDGRRSRSSTSGGSLRITKLKSDAGLW